jgi:uncharacterized protein YecE (DUF72 family)
VESWTGRLFTVKAKRADWLSQYSQAFGTVEGNSTFYGLPTPEAVERWIAQTEPGFQFALKFPRAITHDKQLRGAEIETQAFLSVLEPLHAAGRLGPSFVQLPPAFSGSQLADLERYLDMLPEHMPWAVEFRHRDYFSEGRWEQQADELLASRGIDRVLLDSRPLYSAPPTTDCEHVSQTRKPKVAVRFTVTARRPFVRLIGRDDVNRVLPWCEEWSDHVARWLNEGLEPYFFTHTPDDHFAPDLAALFVETLRKKRPQTPGLPIWPGEKEKQEAARQKRLF